MCLFVLRNNFLSGTKKCHVLDPVVTCLKESVFFSGTDIAKELDGRKKLILCTCPFMVSLLIVALTSEKPLSSFSFACCKISPFNNVKHHCVCQRRACRVIGPE